MPVFMKMKPLNVSTLYNYDQRTVTKYSFLKRNPALGAAVVVSDPVIRYLQLVELSLVNQLVELVE